MLAMQGALTAGESLRTSGDIRLPGLEVFGDVALRLVGAAFDHRVEDSAEQGFAVVHFDLPLPRGGYIAFPR
jgi:hypothetical protein